MRRAVFEQLLCVEQVWKGLDWDLLDVLFEKGWIADPKGKAKSVMFTEEGTQLAKEFLSKHFGLRRSSNP